ncbi:isoprenyl transferase [Mycetocola reblochoni]|uniref:Isoprenyl transferase n=2 Tax=Mycetocola reblochoni TaxID=331618 RepID=A0A1R4IAQ0_9MICO|nr:isoprenyl transferase [Mycetocola reblochoni]RLP67593.1 isoprenyl transferase [Mycetocola reblochoni]SJN16961.1 Undecaprenyl diphosphate synthase [Mycetocola reblochoni REB411]
MYGLYEKSLRRGLTPDVIPHHVAMIIDGNRRWARQLGLASAADGHRAGAAKVAEFLDWCDELGVGVVTLYLLSSDNLRHRDSDELQDLIEIIADLAEKISTHRDWQVKHVGSLQNLPERLVGALRQAEGASAGGTGLHVNLAVGYGGRTEIVDAIRSIVADHGATGGTIDSLADELTPELIGEHLYTSGQPDPDLVIRTSGEQRLSDFMLWQSAHSEFYFVEALGPDLRQVDFLRALRDYAGRQRRFGG